MIIARLVVVALVMMPTTAAAHRLAPSYLHVALGQGEHVVTLRHARTAPPPILRSPCVATPITRSEEDDLVIVNERWTCPTDARVTLVTEPGAPPMIVELARGADVTMQVLDAASPTFALEAAGPAWSRWIALGVEHLARGLDHVLVIVALVALVGLRRRLVWALTAFTLGHSLSLALAATGVVSLPEAVVEIAIALTLVALGLELAAPADRERPGVIVRRPWLGGIGLGLVHGLGFAGALGELVVTRDAGSLAPAILGFNVGLELAQLALVLLLASIARVASRLPMRWPVGVVAGWVVGVAGAAWAFDRAWP